MAEIRTDYHAALVQLRDDVARMSGLVAENISRATHYLLEGGADLPADIRGRDDEIDRMFGSAEERVFVIVARQAPLASELRDLMAILRIIHDLERSGDLMLTVVKAAEAMGGRALPARIRGLVQRMSEETQFLHRAAMEAYMARDVEAAEGLEGADDQLDALTAELYSLLETEDLDRSQVMNLSLVARCYERIGDHAVEIASHAVFVKTGQIPSAR